MALDTSEALDLSKENVQPLRQGRKAARLQTVLQAQNDSEVQKKLLKERQEFEHLMQTYEGDDPLYPYWEYVNWIEQSYPKQGPDSNLMKLLEYVIIRFINDDQYKQDTRYVQLVVKFISRQSKALDLYHIIYKKGIGKSCALFYKAWAEEFDNSGDFKRADTIFQLGIKNQAQPMSELVEAHTQYQLSFARRVLSGQIGVPVENESSDCRSVLSKLKPSTMGTTRSSKGSAGILQSVTKTKKTGNNIATPVSVYKEKEDDDDKFIPQCDENGKEIIPIKVLTTNKENIMKPSIWRGQKQKQIGRIRPSDTPTTPFFKVHVDADSSCKSSKKTTTVNALKPRSKEEMRCPAVLFQEPDPKVKVMYPKHLVYRGGHEFSLEQIRAEIYWKKLKALEEKKEERKDQLEKKEEEMKKEEKSVQNMEQKVSMIQLKDDKKCNSSTEMEISGSKISMTEQRNKNSKESSNENTFLDPFCISPSTSITIHTKAALNVLHEMWTSPSPKVCRVKKNLSSDHQNFKIPVAPTPSTAGFSVFEDKSLNRIFEDRFADSESNSKPTPPLPPMKLFNVFEDVEKPQTSAKPFSVFKDSKTDQQDDMATKCSFKKCPPAILKPAITFTVCKDDENKDNFLSGSSNKSLATNRLDVPFTKPRVTATGDINDNDLASPLSMNNKPKIFAPKLTLPYIPPPLTWPELESEDKENNPPKLYEQPTEKRHTNGVLVPAQDIQISSEYNQQDNSDDDDDDDDDNHLPPVVAREIDFDDVTCNTRAFNFTLNLPQSTPYMNICTKTSLKNIRSTSSVADGSYLSDDIQGHFAHSKKTEEMDQNLSIILEGSKEKYSSSSGSSGSSAATTLKTFVLSEKKLGVIEEQNDSENTSSSSRPMRKQLQLDDEYVVTAVEDPFNLELHKNLLNKINFPKNQHIDGYEIIYSNMPCMKLGTCLKLGNDKWIIDKEIGNGAYAKIYKGHFFGKSPNEIFALKKENPACYWEWYIVKELHFRLTDSSQKKFFIDFKNGYFFDNGSILSTQWAKYGTILDFTTLFKRIKNVNCPITVATELSIQMMNAISYLHSCKIIHGDVKPDNFVLSALPQPSKPCIQLIDFGRSIDMNLFAPGTTFTKKVTTECFECNEMRDGKPWTYQIDLFGLASCMYMLLMGDYMKTIKRGDLWILLKPLPRYLRKDILDPIFHSLLNIPSCDELPELQSMKNQLQDLISVFDDYTQKQHFNSVCNVLSKR